MKTFTQLNTIHGGTISTNGYLSMGIAIASIQALNRYAQKNAHSLSTGSAYKQNLLNSLNVLVTLSTIAMIKNSQDFETIDENLWLYPNKALKSFSQ